MISFVFLLYIIQWYQFYFFVPCPIFFPWHNPHEKISIHPRQTAVVY
ncbi:hypothetical protein HMPREF1548_07003 [Clostridium sp. KLE 1755]|nr:hypothetical protein HMPREF1548_07003 [Clostridium sp. KLE 1755]